jgi:hypothetical protein
LMKHLNWLINMLNIKLEMFILNMLLNYKIKKDINKLNLNLLKQVKLYKLSACIKTLVIIILPYK